jgi:hypothetical protein
MALVYTHALPGRQSDLDDLIRCQSRVACFGRVIAVAGTSSIDFFDSNSVVQLSAVLDAGKTVRVMMLLVSLHNACFAFVHSF